MKFSLATITAFVGAISAANLPNAFTLVAEGGKTVLTDGQNAYIGANTTDHEILILRGGSPNGLVSYTAKNGVPTAFQNLYIVEDAVSPLGLTLPHSGAVPEGGNITGFSVNDQGLFTHGGKAWFAIDGYGDNEVKEIYWYGAHSSTYRGEKLYVKELKNYSA
ncbi:hypothetical protein LT330_000385 [Penicillium expansum]|uniref:Uncharacterized protein n=1 Tax=Penicillium expansum TaxID=27334 RepID=A0A0A2JLR2_PENEN|nr:hypothetical protein PEX2_079360 [Penicillium expansum]KAJ5499514.1 hypothetical protein N7453_008565 [Penicillium expansum]KAK4871148.1 hypothetical protein LT330_000385 [Penicillium expansum]KGO42287.1 hypothetical protein PEXP_052390 [Penicillium expansum]KGO56329.1 hypothetical protein PEX2_079360 [Penicillium expansum]KGO64105.1 hypothetical protein PEX1_042600 [Penicillium expansum]